MNVIKEVIEKIKQAGVDKTRITPDGGEFKIEINNNGVWVAIHKCPNRNIAEDVLRGATSRLIID